MDWFRQFLSNEFLRYFFSSFSFFLIKRFTNLNRSEQRFKHCQTPFLSPIFSNVQIQITFSRGKSSICIISSRMTRSTIRELMNGRELKIRVHRASASDRNIERNYQWNIGNWRRRRRKRKGGGTEGDREMEEIYIIYGMGQSKPRIQHYQSESYCDPWGNLAAILTHFTIPFVT